MALVASRDSDINYDHTHGTLPERTYQQLRNLIVKGRIPAGERVLEEEVANRFGVSRTPVREALARLAHEGYLIPTAAGRRTELVVTPLSSQSVRELWGMIGALEGLAVLGIASLDNARREALVTDLENINSQLGAASRARPRNADRLFELQSAFHQRFVNETAGHHMMNIYSSLRPQVQRYEFAYGTRLDADYGPSTSEHLKIIAAIKSGDAERAREAVQVHWSRAAARTISIIDEVVSHPGPQRRPQRKAAPRRRST